MTYPSAPYPHAYSSIVHQEACSQPQSVPQIEYTVFIVNQQTHLAEFPQIDSGLAVLVFKQGDDHIDAINKMMSFLVTVQPLHGRQNSYAAGASGTRASTSGTGGNYSSQQRIMKEKVLLVEAQGNGKVLTEEELEFLADPGIVEAKAVLLANLSSYGSDVLSEVPIFDNTHNDMLNQSVQEMLYYEPSHFVEHSKNEIHSGIIIILYSQYLIESQTAAVQDTNSSAQQDALILSVFEQLSNQKVKELDNIVCKMGQSAQTMHMLTKPQVFYDNNLKQALDFQNPFYLKKAQQIKPMMYDGNVITKETNVISIVDSKETLMLEEKSRSKMFLKQSDPMVLENKVKPINYDELNRLFEDFGKCFVLQRELSDEQALHPSIDQSASSLVKIEAPQELPKKGNGDILNEVTEVQTDFNQMEVAVQRYHVDKQCFEIQKKQFLIENDRLLDPIISIISQDIVNVVVNSSVDVNTSVKVNSFVIMNGSMNYMEMCNKCLELEAELIKQHNMVEKDEYNRLSKIFSKLEQQCISLEIAMQLNKENFQNTNTSVNQTKPLFDQLFELNNLKAELQAKDTTIKKLKAHIKRINETSTSECVKKDFDEIETINIELEHRVTRLIVENEHLKQTYKQLYGLIKPSRVCAKEQIESLVNQLDPVILAPKVKNNREAHEYYLKHTIEQIAILKKVQRVENKAKTVYEVVSTRNDPEAHVAAFHRWIQLAVTSLMKMLFGKG
ncbi:hypothetical protein Tco_0562655 [Tanacetum coccineum]